MVALPDGGFLIADASNQRVRRVGGDGIITTLIGDGFRGYSGDGGPAAAAQVSVPKAVGLTAAGDVLIADEQNNRIRFVGTVVAPANTTQPTITGSAAKGSSCDGSRGRVERHGAADRVPVAAVRPACAEWSARPRRTPVGASDVGSTLRVGVTGSNAAGSATAYSTQTAVVTARRAAGEHVAADDQRYAQVGGR